MAELIEEFGATYDGFPCLSFRDEVWEDVKPKLVEAFHLGFRTVIADDGLYLFTTLPSALQAGSGFNETYSFVDSFLDACWTFWWAGSDDVTDDDFLVGWIQEE